VSAPVDIGERVTDLIVERDAVVLGCPAGRTPVPIYESLVRRVDVSLLRIVMMDEYLGPDQQWVPSDAPHSCRGFMARYFPMEHVYTPDPKDPDAYEDLIDSLGGIDLFILALGDTDGHVAFNPPGTPADSRTRVIELGEATRRDNLGTFPSFRSLEEVPRFGVSVGLGTIAAKSRAAVLVAHGAHKANAVARTLALDAFDEPWPASVIYNCANPSIIVDTAPDLRVSSGC
jgi:glucosamine-6-phosphate deaminase